MKTILLTLFVLTILSSCKGPEWCAERFPQVARVDSFYIEKLKEVPIYLPGDSIDIEFMIDCPDQEVATIETGKLKQEISILNKILKSKTKIKPDTVIVYVPEIREKIVIEKQPVEVRYVPRLIRLLSYAGIGAIVLLAVLLALKMRNLGKFMKKLVG